MRLSRQIKQKLGAGVVIGAMAIGGSALAAASTVNDNNAGQDSGATSGFTVSNISWTAAADRDNIASIEFHIVRDSTNAGTAVADANAKVYVSPDGGTAWYTCAVTAGDATCATTSPQLTFASITTVQVVAHDYVAPTP